MSNLRDRWLHLAVALEIGAPAAEEIWQSLAMAYEADGRFYHTLDHIQHVLEIADHLAHVATDFTAVRLALWFHDVVYDPRRSDNEAKSAAFAERVLRPQGVPDATLAVVRDLILATKSHETAVPAPNLFVMLDADLAIMGASTVQYDAYAQAIRQEYSFVPDEAYALGRTAILKRFLARSPFYFTAWMRERFETAVRLNLTRELELLKT